MTTIFITAFTVLFPLFSKIAIGMVVRKVGFLQERSIAEMNNLVFRILLPALLFVNIYQSDFRSITSFDFLWLFSSKILN